MHMSFSCILNSTFALLLRWLAWRASHTTPRFVEIPDLIEHNKSFYAMVTVKTFVAVNCNLTFYGQNE